MHWPPCVVTTRQGASRPAGLESVHLQGRRRQDSPHMPPARARTLLTTAVGRTRAPPACMHAPMHGVRTWQRLDSVAHVAPGLSQCADGLVVQHQPRLDGRTHQTRGGRCLHALHGLPQGRARGWVGRGAGEGGCTPRRGVHASHARAYVHVLARFFGGGGGAAYGAVADMSHTSCKKPAPTHTPHHDATQPP